VNGWIRTEKHFSVSTVRFCLWNLHFFGIVFQYPHFLHSHGSLTELYVLLIRFLFYELPLIFLLHCSDLVSTALRAMCATTIHTSIKRLLIFKCQINSFYLCLYALGCLVFFIYICIERLWHLHATANTSLKLRKWEIRQIQEENDRAHRRTRTNDPSSHAVKCIMSLRQCGHLILLVPLFNSGLFNPLNSSNIFSSLRVISTLQIFAIFYEAPPFPTKFHSFETL
jgi:hypothetical protein